MSFYLCYLFDIKKDRMIFVSTVIKWKAPIFTCAYKSYTRVIAA